MALAAILVVLSGFGGIRPASAAGGHTWTTDADFNEGIMVGVNHAAPDHDQLQLNKSSSTFPFIWVANSADNTISKLDTVTGKELGRYRTAPDGYGADPSRTTVDLDGNVWVGNRGGNTLTKVGLLEAGNCVDSNHNGVIDTSNGPLDVKPWVTAGSPADECILLNVAFPAWKGNNVRMVAIDSSNNVYAGSSDSSGWFHYFDGRTGALLKSVQSGIAMHYGGVVDPEGRLWISAHAQNRVVRYDPEDGSLLSVSVPHLAYGIGIDKFGNVWSSGWSNGTITKIRRDDGYVYGTYWIPSPYPWHDSRGVAVDDNGDVWVANSASDSVGHLRNDGSPVGWIAVRDQPTGVAIDAAGKIWATNLGDNSVTRIDPVTSATDTFPVGAGPYNYSDMTGQVVRNITTTLGTWTVTYDSGTTGTAWSKLSWTADTSVDTRVKGRVRAADTPAGLGGNSYVAVGNGVGFTGPVGRYVQIEMTLETDTEGETPVLRDVTIAPQAPCDPNPGIAFKSPLNPAVPYELKMGDTLPIRFRWGTCDAFIHDESVIMQIEDPLDPEYPITASVYGFDVAIDDAEEEYQDSFDSSLYPVVEVGKTYSVSLYIGDQFAGQALFTITP